MFQPIVTTFIVFIAHFYFVSCAHQHMQGKVVEDATDGTIVKPYPKEWKDPLEMFAHEPNKRNTIYDEKPESVDPNHSRTVDHVADMLIEYSEVHPEDVPVSQHSDHTESQRLLDQNNNCEAASNANVIFLQRFIGHILSRISEAGRASVDVNKYDAVFELAKVDEDILSKFVLDSSSVNSINDVVDRFEKILISVSLREELRMVYSDRFVKQFEQYFGTDIYSAALFVFIIFLVIAALSLEFFSHISWGTQLKRLLLLTIIISFPWTFFHEYKLAVAEHQSASMSMPKHCSSLDSDTSSIEYMTQSIGSLYRYYFSTAKDPCREYHERFLIDPLMKVPPTKVIAVTLTKLILEPLSHAGTAFSITFKNMFSELPVQLWIPAFVFIFVLMLVILLLTSVLLGYSWNLSLPFWTGFQIAPAQPAAAIEQQPAQVAAVPDSVNEIKMLKQQLQELQDVLEKPKDNSRYLRQRALSAPSQSPDRGETSTNLPYPPNIQSPFIPGYDWNVLNSPIEEGGGDCNPETPPYPVYEAPPYPVDGANMPPPPVFEDVYSGDRVESAEYKSSSDLSELAISKLSRNDSLNNDVPSASSIVASNGIRHRNFSEADFVTECIPDSDTI